MNDQTPAGATSGATLAGEAMTLAPELQYNDEWIALAAFSILNRTGSNMDKFDAAKQLFRQMRDAWLADSAAAADREAELEAQLSERYEEWQKKMAKAMAGEIIEQLRQLPSESRRLAAGAGEWVDAIEEYWGYFNIERNGRAITVFVDEDAQLDNGYLLVPLPDTVRLQLRRVVATSEATGGDNGEAS